MKIDSGLALIAIIVSVVAVPSSAILAYHYAKKQFKFQVTRERSIRLVSALGAAISVSEQLGSLIRMEATKKLGTPNSGVVSTEAEELFKRNAGEIYAAVARWPICSELQKRLNGLIECGIIEEIKHDTVYYDKFISLYWQLRAHHINDADKIRISHVILYSQGLLGSLKGTLDKLANKIE
ncbi:MAG: hypothetical protein AB1585_15070 [Thermodesulfobacteriota bacterium]